MNAAVFSGPNMPSKMDVCGLTCREDPGQDKNGTNIPLPEVQQLVSSVPRQKRG